MAYLLDFDERALKEWHKLGSSGYRLVYQVQDEKVVVFVVAVGKRERSEAYNEAEKRRR